MDDRLYTIKKENKALGLEYQQLVLETEEKFKRKNWLEISNTELNRELMIKTNIVKMKLNKISKINLAFENNKNKLILKEKIKEQKEMINMLSSVGVIKEEDAQILSSSIAHKNDTKFSTEPTQQTLFVDGINLVDLFKFSNERFEN